MNLTKTAIQIVFCSCLAIWQTGCNREEPVAATDPKEIGFDIASLPSMRGNVLTDKSNISSMGIFGYSTNFDVTTPLATSLQSATPNLMHNQQATYNSSLWEYTPVAYWPMDLSVRNSFFAYSPHSSENTNVIASLSSATGTPKITYTLPEEPTEMVDILYSAPVLNKNRNSTEKVSDGRVVYDMKHALCWLSFVVAPEIYGNDSEATYEVDWLSFMADHLPSTATLDLGTGGWTNMVTDFRKYDFVLTDAAQSIKSGNVALVINESSHLMLLPFEINKTTGATIDITFWYKGIQYYYFAPLPTQIMTAGNIVVFVLNISPDGAVLTFQSEERIDNWLKGWEKDDEDPESEPNLDIF